MVLFYSCSKKVHDITKDSRNFQYENLINLKYQDFFDSTYNFDYEKLLAYRKIENDVPEGLEKRKFYNLLALLESYLNNYSKAIVVTDKARLEPTDMMVFDSLGNMTKSIFYPEKAFSNFPDSLFSNKYKSTKYSDFLKNLDDQVQVFAMNETHTVPLFRKSLYQSLPILKDKGFKYLVLETLYQEKQAEMNLGKEPRKDLGFFNSEITMGDLIRKAKELNFILISYDAQGADSQSERETLSFQNIIKRTLAKEPQSKIILFAGHSHIAEAKIGRIKNLGLQFLEYGIDPLTINQFSYYERNVSSSIKEPTIFEKVNTERKSRYDYLLVIPKSQIIKGRPSWLWEMDRKPIVLEKKRLKFSPPFIIEAYYKKESSLSVPIDRVEITDIKNIPSLALRNGEFTIRLISKSNKICEFDLYVN